MFFSNIEYDENIALIQGSEIVFTYSDLLKEIKDFSRFFNSKHLIFIIGENDVESIVAYLFSIEYGVIPLLLGSKTNQGFYKKVVENGKKSILSLDLNTLEYRPGEKVKFATLEATKSIDNTIDRFKVLVNGKDKAGVFYRKNFAALFGYVQHRIPEISDELFRIDDAMKAGFGWEHGPFEIWDAVGIEKGIELMKAENIDVAEWVDELLAKGIQSFYSLDDGAKTYYSIPSKSPAKVPGQDNFIILDTLREHKTIWSNSEASIQHLGDGVLNVEFQSKMNTLGGEVLQAINKGIDLAETEYDAVILGNQGANFSVGANLAMAFMMLRPINLLVCL